jgi:hypothetical protein
MLEDDDHGVRHVTVEERLAGVSISSPTAAMAAVEPILGLGHRVADKLLASGAGPMLDRMRRRLV